MIPYGRQSIDAEDIRAVVDTLQSDWLTQGPAVERFEAAVASHCGSPHAVAVNSATSALQIAYLALGLGPGDTLWTSPNTFVATANAALLCGASVDFVDIDPRTYNLSVDALRAKLAAGGRPKIVAPVHFSGQPCDLRAIAQLAREYGFAVVEDASHAIGATYEGRPIGDCRYSDIAIFSFHPVKIVTTGEGGMALTNQPELAERMRRLRSHGIVRSRAELTRPDEGPWYYEQHELGFNFRMTDLQAALGESQMRRLDTFIARRRQLAARYDEALRGLPLSTPWQATDGQSAWHLYVIQLDPALIGKRRQIVEQMRAAGVFAHVHYIPVHLQPYYRQLGFQPGQCPAAETYYERAITVPLYAGMSDADQDEVVRVLGRLLNG